MGTERRSLSFSLPAGRQAFYLLTFAFAFLSLGMIGRGGGGGGQLKPELRYKIYDQAIQHYEKAEAHYTEGRPEEALRELKKAVKEVRAFPEAYALMEKIYLKRGEQEKAREARGRLVEAGGPRGLSPYSLREEARREIEIRKASMPPPDIEPVPAVFLALVLTGLLIFGMVYEYRHLTHNPQAEPEKDSLILESFPGEEKEEIRPSWLFKLCVFLLPAPFLLLLLLLLGIRHMANLVPVFLFGLVVMDLAIYLLFFADFSGFGGMRRPGGGMGGM